MNGEAFRPPEPGSGPIPVEVDPDLWALVPTFLANRRKEVEVLRAALAAGDAAAIRQLGHNLRGMGGGYGFEYISTVGRALERMAAGGDLTEGPRWVDALADYLERVEPREGEAPPDDEDL